MYSAGWTTTYSSGLTQTYVDLHFSPDDYDHPKTSGVVRANCDMIGTVFKKIDEHTTSIDMYARSDPDLKLVPQSFIEKGSKDSGYTIKYFSDYMDKHHHHPNPHKHHHEAPKKK